MRGSHPSPAACGTRSTISFPGGEPFGNTPRHPRVHLVKDLLIAVDGLPPAFVGIQNRKRGSLASTRRRIPMEPVVSPCVLRTESISEPMRATSWRPSVWIWSVRVVRGGHISQHQSVVGRAIRQPGSPRGLFFLTGASAPPGRPTSGCKPDRPESLPRQRPAARGRALAQHRVP